MKLAPRSVLLLYSGGLDSTTALFEFRSAIGLCLSLNYGSKHNAREIEFAKRNCTELEIEQIVLELPFIEKLFKSDLLQSGGAIPLGHYTDQSMQKTVVPFRNGIMLSIAAGLAESRELDTVLLANHAGDRTIYPDCRPAFIEAMQQAIRFGSGDKVALFAPYTEISKREIALRGRDIGLDYARTWSCYKGGTRHCGRCGTCVERREALQGFDPSVYDE